MLQTCSKCGAANTEHAVECYVCDAPLLLDDACESAEAEPVAAPSSEPQWRREVAHRLEAYRARRHRLTPHDSQVVLPFASNDAAMQDKQPAHGAPRISYPPKPEPRASKPRDRIEIAVVQPELNFSAREDERLHPSAPLVPVADLGDRARAGLLDAACLLLTYAGFLALFRSLGGELSLGKPDAIVYAVTFFLFYMQYFAFFTAFGGATPGMLLRGLSVVSFEGSLPSFRQLLWRSFGYVVSGGTLLLGFLWALWDEDQLTWQDRISQTYVTHALPLGVGQASHHDAARPPR